MGQIGVNLIGNRAVLGVRVHLCGQWCRGLLRRWPRAHRAVANLYYFLREGLERSHLGTSLEEYLWRRNSLLDERNPGRSFESGLHDPHRASLIEAIRQIVGVRSVLEVGCNAGFNLFLLAHAIPGVALYGIDINRRALDIGRQQAVLRGLGPITLREGSATNLAEWARGSVDVVVSDSVLMYVAPDRIESTLRGMLVAARVGIVLSEWHAASHQDSPWATGLYVDGHWVYDYVRAFRELTPELQPKIVSYTDDEWTDKNWRKFGCILTLMKPTIVAASDEI